MYQHNKKRLAGLQLFSMDGYQGLVVSHDNDSLRTLAGQIFYLLDTNITF